MESNFETGSQNAGDSNTGIGNQTASSPSAYTSKVSAAPVDTANDRGRPGENDAQSQKSITSRSAFTEQFNNPDAGQNLSQPPTEDRIESNDHSEPVTYIAECSIPTEQLRRELPNQDLGYTAPRSAFTQQSNNPDVGQNLPQPTKVEYRFETKDYLMQKAKSAEARWRAAPLKSEERTQALNEFMEAEDTLKELGDEPVMFQRSVPVMTQKSVPTEQLRREVPNQDLGFTAPRTALNPKPRDSTWSAGFGAEDDSSEAEAGQQKPSKSRNRGSDSMLDSRQRESDVLKKDQHNRGRSDAGRSSSIRNLFGSRAQDDGQDEGDLEAGTMKKSGKKGRTDSRDVHGRKRIFAPKRDERIVDPVPKKANYGPGAIPLPEPTYLDRQGRTELEVFQALVGIYFLSNAGAPIDVKARQLQPASVMSDIFLPSRAAAYRHRNRGLYDRCISQDMKMRVMYSFSHYMISFLYLLQILVAATLTGLSSYTNTAGVALTTLGAVNTVLAGILAWLNGQGMPTRYRRSRDQYREVVRAIEDAERMFSTIDYVEWPEGKRPTPVGERDRLFKMYEKARQDQEANYPDTHESADKSEVMNRTKELEAKIEKHKKQKKDKTEELKAALAKLEEKHASNSKDASNSNDSESTAAESHPDVEQRSKDDLDKYAQQLDVRKRIADLSLAGLTRERTQAQQDFEAMKRIIKNMCKERDVDDHEVNKELERQKESNSR